MSKRQHNRGQQASDYTSGSQTQSADTDDRQEALQQPVATEPVESATPPEPKAEKPEQAQVTAGDVEKARLAYKQAYEDVQSFKRKMKQKSKELGFTIPMRRRTRRRRHNERVHIAQQAGIDYDEYDRLMKTKREAYIDWEAKYRAHHAST